MDGAAADAPAAIVAAELERIVAAGDAFAEPIELLLLVFIGGEVLERAPEETGVERDDRKSCLGQLAGQGAAPGAGPDNREINLVFVAVTAHRDPAAGVKHVRRAPVLGTRAIGHDALPPPRNRGGRSRAAHNRAAKPGRQSRSRSRPPGARNRRSPPRAAAHSKKSASRIGLATPRCGCRRAVPPAAPHPADWPAVRETRLPIACGLRRPGPQCRAAMLPAAAAFPRTDIRRPDSRTASRR